MAYFRAFLMGCTFVCGIIADAQSLPNKLAGAWRATSYSCVVKGKSDTKSFRDELSQDSAVLKFTFEANKVTREGVSLIAGTNNSCVFGIEGVPKYNGEKGFSLKVQDVRCSEACRSLCQDNPAIAQILGKTLVYQTEVKGQMLVLKRRVVGQDPKGQKTHLCPPHSEEVILLRRLSPYNP